MIFKLVTLNNRQYEISLGADGVDLCVNSLPTTVNLFTRDTDLAHVKGLIREAIAEYDAINRFAKEFAEWDGHLTP